MFEKIRRLLEREIQIEDELQWCITAEEELLEVLEGIVMRKEELEADNA